MKNTVPRAPKLAGTRKRSLDIHKVRPKVISTLQGLKIHDYLSPAEQAFYARLSTLRNA